MPKPIDPPGKSQQRARIAGLAARLIAESGIEDYAQAKRKAARTLGLPESTQLPENSEVESELRNYQRLFQDSEHAAILDHLRRKACQIMQSMQPFNPYLAGSVLDGTAGCYSEIDIQLFTDSAKDVEIFLLNQDIAFKHKQPRSNRAEAVLTIEEEDSVTNLIIYPANEERVTYKTRDGRVRPRARRDAVLKLISPETAERPR